MEIVYDVFDHITGGNRSKKVLVIGWDWGGNMGLSLALSPLRQRCTGLALYHPSWTDKIELLHGIALPVLLLWVPSDQLHLFSVGRRMARIIPRSQLISLVSKPGSSAEVWPVIAAKITDWIGKQYYLHRKRPNDDHRHYPPNRRPTTIQRLKRVKKRVKKRR